MWEIFCLLGVLAPFLLVGAAVTANQVVKRSDPNRGSGPIAASTTIYEGTLLFWNASGYIVDDDGAGLNEFAGIAIDNVDNSAGSAGDKSVEFWVKGVFLLTGSGFAQGTVGDEVYASDNYTLGLAADQTTYVGRIVAHQSTTTAWVEINARRNRAYLRTVQSVDNVTAATPTAAELATAFGAAASLGRGFIGTVDDADGDAASFIVWTTDASFYFVGGTKAA